MTQEERWLVKYNEVKNFIETNKRNPSKHRIEEHDMLNWLKANRKAMNAGKMKPERIEKLTIVDFRHSAITKQALMALTAPKIENLGNF